MTTKQATQILRKQIPSLTEGQTIALVSGFLEMLSTIHGQMVQKYPSHEKELAYSFNMVIDIVADNFSADMDAMSTRLTDEL